MTPSSTRAISPRPASRPACRTRLLAASALGVMAAMLAQPGLAALPGIPSAANITVSTGGSQPVITAPTGSSLDIDLNAPRTVINWASLHVSNGESMTYHFDAASDVVLNKTTTQIAIDSGGTISGLVGAASGGNIWYYSPQGVIVSPGAIMTGGGFLFSRGSSLSDVSFVDAADPLANLRAATDALIQITTVSTATNASINSTGDVVLSASSGSLNANIVEGATASVSTTVGSITVAEVTATTGAASVTAAGPGATVTSILGATGATVSSNNNTSVGTAKTTTSGDIVITSNGSASLTSGDSKRDILVTAPTIFLSTVDAVRDVILTGTDGTTVTNRIFAGDDIELTASNGDVAAGGAFLKATGAGASDDAHILLRSDTGSVDAGNTLLTQGTGVKAGDITIQAATTATLNNADSSRDVKVIGVTATLNDGTAARDVFVTATTGPATVNTQAIAGDDVEVTTTSGNVLASGATLQATGVGASNDAHVLVRSTSGNVNVGTAQTLGGGATAGDITIDAGANATLGAGGSSRDLTVSGVNASLTGGSAVRDLFVTATSGNATVASQAVAGDDVEVTTTNGNVLASGATMQTTGVGASDDAHILARSTNGNVNVGTAQTLSGVATAGDVTIDAGANATLGTGGSSRDLTVSGVNASLTDGTAARDLFVTATLGNATVATQAIGGDDVEITTSNGNVLASGATLRATGAGASDDARVLARSTSGSVDVGTAETQGTGSLAGDVTINAAIAATLGTGDSSRDLTVTGVTASLTDGSATRDLFVTATTGGATVTTQAMAGDDVEVTATTGDVSAVAATLKSTGVGATDEAHVLAKSTGGTVDVGAAITQGTGVAAGDATINASTAATLGTASSTHDLVVTGASANLTDGAATRDLLVTATTGNATVTTQAVAGDDVEVTTASGDVSAGGATLKATGAGGSDDAHVLAKSTNGSVDVGSAITQGTGVLAGDVTLQAGGSITGTSADSSRDVLATAALDLDLGSATAARDIILLSMTGQVTLGKAVLIGSGAGHDLSITAAGDAILGEADPSTITAANIFSRTGGNTGTVTVTSTGGGDALVHLDTSDRIDTLQGAGVDVTIASGPATFGNVTALTNDIYIEALDGDALVQLAMAPHTVTLASSNGAATLRGAEGPDGVVVAAFGTATFGADDKASITAANYVVTDPGCGCAGGLQVTSSDGDAAVNINSASNGIAVIGAAIDGDATVVQKTGDLKIDDLAAFNITAEAVAGTLEIGSATSSGGDYTITAHDFLGTALTPNLFFGDIHDVTITDTLGNLNLAGFAIHAGHKLTIVALNGAVIGAGQLDAGTGAGDGDVEVTADAIALDTITADGRVALNAGTGAVNVATSVSVDGDYLLTGGDFSAAALAPLGARAGSWSILDQAGDFDFIGKTLHYGGAIDVDVTAGNVSGGNVTSDLGGVSVQADGGRLGAVYAGGADVIALARVGGMAVDSADGVANIEVTAATGAASLGSAVMRGAGANSLTVQASNGDVILGAATPGAIAAANIVNSSGATTTVVASAPAGAVDVNLDHITSADLTTIDARNDVGVQVLNGSLRVGDVRSTNGAIYVGGGGPLTINGAVRGAQAVSIDSHGGMTIAGSGTVRADGAGDAVVLASDGVFTNGRGSDAVAAPNGRWLIYTQAAGDPLGSTAGDTFNGLAGKSFYGSAYSFTTDTFALAPNAGNRFVHAYRPTLTVTPDSASATYSGAIPTTTATITGLINGDLIGDAVSGAIAVSGATASNAGTYTLTADLSGLTSDLNYAFASGAGSLRIDRKALTGALVANNKTFDGTTAATGSIDLTGVLAGDVVTASGSYAFADKNAGVGKTVTASNLTLTGAAAANYDLTGVSTDLADILRRPVAVAADNMFKEFRQAEPTLTYHITAGSLAAGDAFSGALIRGVGEQPGDYQIARGTLDLSANYDLTFTGAVFTIRAFPSNQPTGSAALKHLTQSPDFTLDWDPEPNLTTEGTCSGEGCPPVAAVSEGAQLVATLR